MKPQGEPAIAYLLTILPDKCETSTLFAERKHAVTKLGGLGAGRRRISDR